MEIRLSEHFSYGKLLRFTFPSVAMLLFCSIYGMVDGFFVSNYVGATQFAALNLIWPYTMVLGAVGFMIGSGGTALVSKTLGEGKPKLANEYFSMMIYAAIVIGLFLDILGLSLMRPVARLMGADGELLEYAVQYGNIIMAAMPTFMLQCVFQPFMVTAERARLGLWFTVASGLTNMFFDWLFIGVFGWGIRAAAAATVLSQVVGFALPMIYFLRRNNSLLRLGRPSTDMRAFFKACSNGMSELVTNLSISLVGMLYNQRLLLLAGENGVNAYGVISYVSYLFLAMFLGYSMGISPVVGFNYGARNRPELRSLRRKSIVLLSLAALVVGTAGLCFSDSIASFFADGDLEFKDMAARAFRLYSFSYFLSHYNIFASAFFTALNNGKVSAAISFSRTILLQVGAILLLPCVLGLDGIWLAMPLSELLCSLLSFILFQAYRRRYGY